MMKNLILLFFIVPDFVMAQQDKEASVKYYHLFYNIDDHFLNSFTDNYGFYHLAAIAGSYGMVETGFDWEVHEFARKNQWIPGNRFYLR